MLQIMGCDLAQGFHIAKPMGLEALVAFLEDWQISNPLPEGEGRGARRKRWEGEGYTLTDFHSDASAGAPASSEPPHPPHCSRGSLPLPMGEGSME